MAFELTPWRRMGEIRPFWREMENFWDQFLRETPQAESAWGWSPSIDVSETDGKIQVKAELSGLEPKDIDVDVTDNILTIKGEKKKEEEQKGEKYMCRERYFGTFQRSFRLPSGTESDKVEAEFKNGILTINIPKSEESKQKKIEIKSAQ
ncbi:MAG: Hsp20/alpha crystallin family protein [Syntrophales bacterium]|nr:Hsp20/alpha crystallin family protein [Syntrophales bacterium]MDY0044662.1 Hsp20/alpha crystallin family protein [Syntrophales bacterium]